MSVLTRPGGPAGPVGGPGGGGGDGGQDRPPRPTGPPPPPAPPASAARPGSARGAAPPADLQADAIATTALCVLTLAGVYSLSRLFSSGSYAGQVVTMVIVMHAVAWGCRRQGLRAGSAVAVSAASLVLLLAWLVVPETTRYGLPLTATLRAAHQAINDATHDFHAVTAPAPVTRGFLFITVAAVGVIALIADWAAFRMRATLEAVVPSFTLFVFAAALGGHKHRNATIVFEVAALLAFVVVHQVTVNQEGSAWFASRTRGALASSAQVGAALGVVALLAGLVLGPALPGAGSKALILWRSADRAGGGGTRTIPSPLVDLRTRLHDYANVEVFTVKSSSPEYWRLTSLDAFNGTEWSSDNSYNSVSHRLPGASTPTPGQRIEQDYAITGPISSIWLPAAYEPDTISGIRGVSYNSDSGSLISDHDTTQGLTYHVSSVITVGQLNPQKLEAAGPVPGGMQRYTKLPQIPQSIIDLTRSVVNGKTTDYDKAKALQDYFRSPIFTYDDTFTGGDSSNALEQFLFVNRRGYCQQFAGAFAVMARALGLPTRVAVGFSYGNQDSAGVWHVKDSFAHAWPEVFFQGYGWVPFEPTPGRGIPGALSYTGQPQQQAGQLPSSTATTIPGQKPGKTGPTPPTSFRVPKGQGDTGASATVPTSHGTSSTVRLFEWVAAVILLVGLWLAIVGGTWWFRRSWRRALLPLPAPSEARPRWWSRSLSGLMRRVHRARRGSAQPAEAVLVAWIDVAELLAWWGLTRSPDETYLEFAHRAGEKLRLALAMDRDAGTGLLRLAKDVTAAEYAPLVLNDEAPVRAAEALRSVDAALMGAADFRHRLGLVLDPRLVFGQAALRRTRAARAARVSTGRPTTGIPVEAV